MMEIGKVCSRAKSRLLEEKEGEFRRDNQLYHVNNTYLNLHSALMRVNSLDSMM